MTSFHIEPFPDVQGARLVGELDLAHYEQTDRALASLFNTTGDVVLDFSELTFIDSSGIRLLIRLHAAVAEHDGKLVLRDPSAHLLRVFDIAGLLDLGLVVETTDG